MKGIILAGGSGTRLFPLTQLVCKQLLPVYDKPIIYYPLSTLMIAGIKDILIISTPEDTPVIQKMFGNGNKLGMSFEYRIQESPKGLADAFIIGEDFIGDDSVCMVLGDNIFYGHGLSDLLIRAASRKNGATVFGYYVNDPERYGVVEFDNGNNVISIQEKPKTPLSNYAVVGLYFYDNSVIEIAKSLKPSVRGEIEITDINSIYLSEKKLSVELMGRGFAWLDTGTHSSRMDAGNFVRTIEERQGLKIACIEEIAYKLGYIDKTQLIKLAEPLIKSGYGEYLLKLLEVN